MDRATLDLLDTPGGLALLSALAEVPDADLADSLTLLTGLRARGVEPDQAAAALTQTRLRRAATRSWVSGPLTGSSPRTDSNRRPGTRSRPTAPADSPAFCRKGLASSTCAAGSVQTPSPWPT